MALEGAPAAAGLAAPAGTPEDHPAEGGPLAEGRCGAPHGPRTTRQDVPPGRCADRHLARGRGGDHGECKRVPDCQPQGLWRSRRS